jgi:lactate dehydrogenase-like 2-hydroxyacid dehydrogenase
VEETISMSEKPRVFVAHPIPEVAINRLREVADVEVFGGHHRDITVDELETAARRSDYIFCMHQTPVTASMIAANPNLRGIGVTEIREDLHDVAACEAAGVRLLEAKITEEIINGNRRATADLMVALLLCLAYRVVEADKYSRATGYFQEMTMDLMGLGCTGKTASLIGLGRVGRFAVPVLRALDLHVLYTKRNRLSREDEQELGVEWVENRDELISRGDYVCMLANYEPSNHKMMGAREFALMKPTAYFINVGRGRLVDEEAMIRALQQGTIAGAGLDVYWNEPPVVHDAYIPEALRKMDNVVLAPHNGGATWDSRGRQTLAIANAIVEDIIRRREAEAASAAASRPLGIHASEGSPQHAGTSQAGE